VERISATESFTIFSNERTRPCVEESKEQIASVAEKCIGNNEAIVWEQPAETKASAAIRSSG
jgi:hypothetical protein